MRQRFHRGCCCWDWPWPQLLGGLHALTPGHGKTLVAAYLIGSRGTVKDAMVLGGTVTLTHTASVLVFGALALLASQAVAATTLVSLLEWCAALLVVGLGARLIWVRWRALKTGVGSSPLGHGHPHPHKLPPGGAGRPTGLLSMGLAGGALPCPEALAILLVAIGLGRLGLGVGLIVSFSVGLAAVLIVILLVRPRSLVERAGSISSRWSSASPLASRRDCYRVGRPPCCACSMPNARLPKRYMLNCVAQLHVDTNHAYSFWGLCARLYTKLTAHTPCINVNRLLGNPNCLQIKHLAFPN